jgi:hypothetical protein
MGFIRGGLFVIASIILFLSMLSAGIFYMMALSLDYDNAKTALVNSADSVAVGLGVYDEFVNLYPLMQAGCNVSNTYNFSIDYGDFEIPCDVISQGINETYYYALGNFVTKDYYNDYNCSILKCLEETKSPSFLISLKTHNYFLNKFYFLFFVSLILIGVMFLLIETKSNLPIVVGIFLVIESFPFLKIDSALSFFASKSFLSFIEIFLTKSYLVFAKFIFFGVLLIFAGIIWKLFLIGFKINKFVNWFKEWRKKRAMQKAEKMKELKKSKNKR